MTSRAPWLLAAALALALLVTTCREDPEVAVALDRAASAEAAAVLFRADRDAALAQADSVAALRALAELAYADSVAAWTAERARLARSSRQQTARLTAAADSLRARGDSTVTVLVDQMEAAHAEAIEAERGQTRAADARGDALDVTVGLLTAEVAGLREALTASMAAEATIQAALDDAVGALRRQGRENRWLRIGTVALVGLAAYDRLQGG